MVLTSLADRLLNIEGIWEEHGFVTQLMKFMGNAPLRPNVPENLYDPVSFFTVYLLKIVKR